MHSKVISFFILVITLFITETAAGQPLSSQEKTKIKKQLKLYLKNPGVFKREQELMANELAALNKSLVTMKERAENAESSLKKLKDEDTKYKEQMELKDQIIADLNKRLNASNNYCQPGEYKVQIGKFDRFSLESYLQNGKCINFEVQNGVKVYTIDGFNDPKEAFNMAQQLRRLGLKGAFVTKFKNNKRVDYDHVAETGEKPFYDIQENNQSKPSIQSKPSAIKYNAPPKNEPNVQYISNGQNEIRNEGYGHTNVKKDKKVINKIIEPMDEEEDVTEDEGAELNTLENKGIKIKDKSNESEDIEIKETPPPAKKSVNVNLNLPTTKPNNEENFEDYEEVKEIPEK